MAECWECEATTSQPVTVTIVLPTGLSPRVRLCPSCYRTYYLPLIAEASADGAHQAPPSPETRATGAASTRR